MRILTIGLGGAGCRIVDRLLAHDQKAPVRCVFGIAIDCDAGQLNSLQHVPVDHRLFFQPLDPALSGDLAAHLPSEEALSRLQALDDGDIDALFIYTGLGGTMAGTAPGLVSYLKERLAEPVFCLCTLPCLQEGDERCSAAADHLDTLHGLLDGIVLFDNESWRGRVFPAPDEPGISRAGDIGALVRRRTEPPPPVSETELFYRNFNDIISRRFTLLLRAGEYSERAPGDLPEVVLDAGEILNTIQGMGFITMGYAREEVPSGSPMDLLSRFRPGTPAVQDGHLKASRVVELAKKAIFEEISAPTALEEAKKALILIAGPSQEMSMRGFMTVRRWIDRTIRGLELRSGDYPVSDTRFLGIFIILAGMESLPAVDTLRQIRDRMRGMQAEPEESPGT
ncbi:MAG TPA: hypothetical protein HA264_00245 [Methanolinea sp.]|jgi:cell division GTPase FtsZ|nr:hypothetical protein [Methanolinea sp.]